MSKKEFDHELQHELGRTVELFNLCNIYYPILVQNRFLNNSWKTFNKHIQPIRPFSQFAAAAFEAVRIIINEIKEKGKVTKRNRTIFAELEKFVQLIQWKAKPRYTKLDLVYTS